ncbi:RNA polymerase factor sigma-54 [Pseudorhodoplanes sinuspersici]|uniref:RNA polymerase sigma-54 factor n=1 Tax=Pseudorhodoplanes sinuspersici TaxID=1235591 RepID=A0A1W6ZMB0_9HYPH|nr:RNA polymerase factor sigma-54 [Pseudorhodoplanes sinuspersici]ARP98553.1 RNA polymerase sigma-54 factor [Pseudorhodoplanes sinuspersici]RKE69876.1 RNA polymerase RpoN-/SigL-like sigma 54 subunit [Pseudorhodoplanes sinuspersici]
MALTTRLEFRQSQALVMTPQLMQAIKLLQLSNLDLMAYVEEELEKNPLLERANDDDGPAAPLEAAGEDTAGGGPDGEVAGEWMNGDLTTSRNAMEDELGTRLDNLFPEDGGTGPGSARNDDVTAAHSEWASVGSGGREDGEYNLEAFVSTEQTLTDHLAGQLSLAVIDPARRMIGQHLIDMVDESGYLIGDLQSVADKLGTSLADVESVLTVLQSFDPAGVCARNLTECLAIQLKERNRYDPAMAALLSRLDLLAKRDFAALRKLCSVGDEDLVDMVTEIKQLNPKPGLAFGSAPVQPIVPDVFVRAAPDGSFNIELNSDTLPKILLNQTYHARVSKTATASTDKAYLAEKLQSATWLIRALDQRARTILKVSAEIVKQQDAFFAHGVQHLRPLNLKTVADAISMHESTVSRVTANKYMATTRGIFELKYFFTSSIAASDGGEAHSAEAVRHRIKSLIDSETADGILSDDTIVEKLRESGIDIARRTVAKYREGMRIASSVQRRREKQSAALAR